MGLWDSYVHQTLTAQWAGEARGYDPTRKFKTQLKRSLTSAVGAADNGIDSGDTSSMPPPLGASNYGWHFGTSHYGDKKDPVDPNEADPRNAHISAENALAVASAKRNDCAGAAQHLGRALHPEQDKTAHTTSHHAATPADHVYASMFWKDPDKWKNWPADQAPTQNATVSAISTFLSIPCNPCAEKAQ